MKKTIVGLLSLFVVLYASDAVAPHADVSALRPNHQVDTIYSRQWSSFSPNGDRLTHATIYDNDNVKIYMCGGSPNGQFGSNLPLIAAYDPGTDSWNTGLSPMPDARGWIQGGYWNGEIRIVGGMTNGSSASNTHYVYDIAGDSWSTGPPLPRATWMHGEVVYNGSHYVIGGANPGFTNGTTNVDRFDIAGGTWSAATPLPEVFDMGGVTIIDNKIYILGGLNRGIAQCWTNVREGTINPSDPDDIVWITRAALPTPVAINAAAVWVTHNLCSMLGGFLNLSTPTDEGWLYDPLNDDFSFWADYPVPITRNHFHIGCDYGNGGSIWCVAGDANGDWAPPNNYYYMMTWPGINESSYARTGNDVFTLTPNICDHTTEISFSLSRPKLVSLSLYNIAGQKVKSILNDVNVAGGEHRISLSLKELPAGAYFVKLEAGDYTDTRKLLVVR